ncbi:MAG: hypothetical protein KDE54_15550, partial [Caldilineaceae bacterium]|nr:hypothetical protein [Caldilineaceae bacterium]
CAGQGEALAALTSALARQGARPHTYGIELSPKRAEVAKTNLDTVLCASYEDVTMSRFAWSLMLQNPPYDTETGNVDDAKPRLEYTFLRNTFMRLQEGGLLIYVVPVEILRKSNVRRSLAAYFDNLQVHRCPAEEYEMFRQIIITGHMRDEAIRDEGMELTLENYCFNPSSIPELPLPGEWDLFVPAALKRPQDIKFFKPVLSHGEIIQAASQHSALHSTRWLRLTELEDETRFRPVVPLKIGHLGSLIASGQMGTVTLTDNQQVNAAGQPLQLIAKGYATKTLAHFDKEGHPYDPTKLTPAEALERAATQREVISTSVFTLDQNGQHQHISTTDQM